MKMKSIIPFLALLFAGCTAHQTVVTYHVAGMGKTEPCSFRLAECRADRFLATAIRKVDKHPSTNDVCFATIHHHGTDIDVIMDRSIGYPSGIYAEIDGKRFAVPGKWLCYLPLLETADERTFDSMIEILELRSPLNRSEEKVMECEAGRR